MLAYCIADSLKAEQRFSYTQTITVLSGSDANIVSGKGRRL